MMTRRPSLAVPIARDEYSSLELCDNLLLVTGIVAMVVCASLGTITVTVCMCEWGDLSVCKSVVM